MDVDLDKLRAEYPDWDLGSRWVATASGPDALLLWADRDDKRITAWSLSELEGLLKCYKLHVSPQ